MQTICIAWQAAWHVEHFQYLRFVIQMMCVPPTHQVDVLSVTHASLYNIVSTFYSYKFASSEL